MQPALTGPAVPTARRAVPLWWWPAALFALAIAAYSLRYVALGAQAYVPELSASFLERPMTIAAHALFGPMALVLGLVNLLPAMRRRTRWASHRVVGRVYMISALAVGGAGLSLAFHAAGGTFARVGFCLLAVATLVTVAQAYLRIRSGDVKGHREWVLRNYALIFGAVTLRIWLPILIIAYGGEFLPAYRWVAWLSWVPNAMWVEWIIRRGWQPSYMLADGSASARLAGRR